MAKIDIGHAPSAVAAASAVEAPRPAPAADAAPAKATQPLRQNIIVIGGSAGALDVLLSLAAGLPADFGGSVFVVSHVGANHSQLPLLLATAGPLPAKHGEDNEVIRPAHIYVAPPDRHMQLRDGRIRLNRGPREHFTRPAIDPLFRSAARQYGAAVIGVVLSGTGSDGASGLEEIKAAGGLALIQQPEDALFPEMPQTAAAVVEIDRVVSSAQLAAVLAELVAQPVRSWPRIVPTDTDMTELEKPAAFTCPECGGALREAGRGGLKMYRCHTGHAFAADELLVQQLDEVERAVFAAVRVLNEHAELCRRMIVDANRAGRTHGVAYWTRLKHEAETQLEPLQRFLLRERPDIAAQNDEPPITHSTQEKKAGD